MPTTTSVWKLDVGLLLPIDVTFGCESNRVKKPSLGERRFVYISLHLSNVARSIQGGTPQFLCKNSNNEQEKMIHCSAWQCQLSQRLIDWPKRRIGGSYAVQPWLSTHSLLFIAAHQEKMRGQRFSSPKDTVGMFKNHVLDVSQSDWKVNLILLFWCCLYHVLKIFFFNLTQPVPPTEASPDLSLVIFRC